MNNDYPDLKEEYEDFNNGWKKLLGIILVVAVLFVICLYAACKK